MSETLEVIRTRYSCRSYDGSPIPSETLREIAAAGLCAPSAMNRQPWRIITLTDKALIEELDRKGMDLIAAGDPVSHQRMMDRGGSLFYNASAMIIVAKQPVSGKFSADLDCGIVAANLVLAARDLGVDSVICGFAGIIFTDSDAEALRQRLGFPPDFDFGISVLLGYANQPANAPHPPDFSKLIEL